ncbi:MAG: aminomethyltransferase family protein [Actinomycetota bacterium]
MSVGTPFHGRSAPLNRKLQWREWAGFWAASAYADSWDIEYNAIREQAALIDVSPLYKYRVEGPDAARLIDRVQVRDPAKLAVGQVWYTCWCDEDGKVVDDGTITRLDDTRYRWTAADPQLRWFRMNARGLDVEIEDVTERTAALALQGPRARDVLEQATGEEWGALRYFRERAASIRGIPVEVTRTGYTGDLGYELWVDAPRAPDLWDAVADAGRPFGARPAGMLALDVARIEAGLILLEVDYTSARHALIPEQAYSPSEIGLGRLVKLDKPGGFVGRRALRSEQRAGGPPRRLVGLRLDWPTFERLHTKKGLNPAVPPAAWRTPVPVFSSGGRQVGRATSGTWSPNLKANLALATVEAAFEEPGAELRVEWTVEARRGRVPATVTPLPFLDLERKRA